MTSSGSSVPEFIMQVFSAAVVILVVGVVASYADEVNQSEVFGAEKCSQVKGIDNAVSCFALSALRKIEDISDKQNIEILPGVLLASDKPITQRTSRQQRTLKLPLNTEDRISKIIDMMLTAITNVFSGRTLKIKMNEETTNEISRAFDEGRGKMKKLAGPLMMALGAKLVAIVPIMIGGLALFASKALIISKLALTVAFLVGVQYLFSNGGGFLRKIGQNAWNFYGNGFNGQNQGGYGYGYAPTWNNGWNAGGSSQAYPYARSMEDPQTLAYSAHSE